MDEPLDIMSLDEEEFEKKAVYHVPDTYTEKVQENKSEISIPRNLEIRETSTAIGGMGIWSTDYIPQGTRFGPLVGEIYEADKVPKNLTNKHYFWRVSLKLPKLFNKF